MSIRRHVIILSLVAATFASQGTAADFADPTWPCVQRKVAQLSVGLMWPFPIEEGAMEAADADLRADVMRLADTLALRRVELETLTPDVADFAEAYGGDPDILGLVFAQAFATLSKRRTRIIDGIGDFSLSQIALSEQIDATRVAMDDLLAADAPDYDRIDELEEQIDWDQVIFTDRQRSITYLCETPTLLEKRLFGIAQMLQQVAREDG